MPSRITTGRLAAAVAVVAIASNVARAADSYWIGAAGGSNLWSAPGSWFNGAVPNAGDVVHLRGALAGAVNNNDLSVRRFGQVLFEALPGGEISQGWDVRGTTMADLVQNRTRDGQRLGTLTNFLDATVDNATPRADAGAIYIGTYILADNLPGRPTSTVTLRPGANGIELAGLGGAGDVVIDGPGYVKLDGVDKSSLTLNGRIDLRAGTLAVRQAGEFVDSGNEPVLDMAAGTTLVWDAASGGEVFRSVNALNGTATLRRSAYDLRLLFQTRLNGSFILDGAMRQAELSNVADGSSFDIRAGEASISRSSSLRFGPNGEPIFEVAKLATVNVAPGATYRAGVGTTTHVARLTGDGTVELNTSPFGPSLTLTPAGYNAVDAALVGSGSLLVDGTGTVDVRRTNSYSGGTTVRNGTLVVSAAVGGLGGGPVSVAGGRLAGTGRISGAVVVGADGTIAPSRADTPGLNTGTLTVRSLAFAAGGTAEIEFNGITAGTQVDQIAVSTPGGLGTADLTGGRLSLKRGSNFFPASGKFARVPIVTAAESITGVFASVAGVRVNDTYSFAVTYDGKNVYAQLADVSDANLDNVQDYRDLFALAAQYKKGTTNQTWTSGDLSGDGTVDYTDLLLANSYVPVLTNAQFAQLKTLNDQQWYDYGRLNGFAVPEPGTLAALSLAGVALRRRRR